MMSEQKKEPAPLICPCIYSCCKGNRQCCKKGYCFEIQKEGEVKDE